MIGALHSQTLRMSVPTNPSVPFWDRSPLRKSCECVAAKNNKMAARVLEDPRNCLKFGGRRQSPRREQDTVESLADLTPHELPCVVLPESSRGNRGADQAVARYARSGQCWTAGRAAELREGHLLEFPQHRIRLHWIHFSFSLSMLALSWLPQLPVQRAYQTY